MTTVLAPMAWPALIKVLVCFCAVLLAGRFKINQGIALGLGGPLLALWAGSAPGQVPEVMSHAIAAPLTLRLAALVLLIMILSRLMQISGRLQRIVDSFSLLVHSPGAVAAVMPSLIGLLPMPGGALFSAPMVEAASPDWRGTNDQGPMLATINYWFRHHGEYWWPLYPGVILAVVLLDVPTWQFVLAMLPLAACHFLFGWFFLLRRVQLPQPQDKPGAGGSLRDFMIQTAPIIIVVAALPLCSLFEVGVSALGLPFKLPEGSPLLIGLLAACIQTTMADHLGWHEVWLSIRRKMTGEMMLLVLGVIVFQAFLNESGVVAQVQDELARYGIPTLALICILPFISGMMSGIAFAMVAASFPLVVPLFSGLEGAAYLAHGGLAFVCGYFGILLSPVHICLLMSRDYFSCTMGGCYKLFAPALVASVVALAVWFGVVEGLSLATTGAF